MKNLTTILTELGIEVPEEKRSELEKQLGENYKPVSEVEKVRAARDNYKTQLDTAQVTLKSFEGVDVNELQGKISTLQNDLAAQKTAFEQQISDMEFNSMLEDAIGKAGARSVKPAREYKWFIPIRVTLTGCDTIKRSNSLTVTEISIHAPLDGVRRSMQKRGCRRTKFQSTHP